MQAARFEFSSYGYAKDFSSFNFHYKIVFGNKPDLSFTETLQPAQPVNPLNPPAQQLAHSILFHLHIMLGISYYKLFCPPEITINSGTLSKDQADFWNTVYTKGLGEFFYTNQIDFRTLIKFPHEQSINPPTRQPANPPTPGPRILLGLGGGKDSLVAADLLKQNNIPTTAFIVETSNQSHLIEPQRAVLKLDSIVVKRKLDPKLIEEVEGAYQGHVPFSAITAFIGLLTAAVYDYRYVAVGAERSADQGNIVYLGKQINHQWSKSREFEDLFRKYVLQTITADIQYFSLTRPLSELKIAQILAEKPSYHHLFSSCNLNFRITKQNTSFSWCTACAKCAFTSLLFAAFLPRKNIAEIFGKDMIADPKNLTLFQKLLGTQGHKPFECVGTYDEVKAAFYLAHKRGEYENTPTMKYFVEKILPQMKEPEKLVARELKVDSPKTIPAEYKRIISNLSV